MDKIKIMIGTPAFSGKTSLCYTIALAKTVELFTKNNIEYLPLIFESGSLLVAERNRIIQSFWESDCTHLLCIDSDLGWPEQSILSMINTNKEFIGGVYPTRKKNYCFFFKPFQNEDESLVQDTEYNHLIKMQCIPSGFMLIARSAIEKMRNKYPELYYSPKDPRCETESAYCFFNTEVIDGEFWGEDYVFCLRAIEAGIDIWVDPLIQFNHDGKIGMLLDILQFIPTKTIQYKTTNEAA